MEYLDFLKNKRFVLESSGFDIDKSELNPMLYEFQKDIVRWALKKGKACIFADCGLGKTPMQLSWAYQVHKHTGGKILILAPLAVADQTKREAEKFGYVAKVVEKQEDCIDGINITNYEKLDRFIAKEFVGIVLDESSILKSYSGKVRTAIIQNFHEVPYKLACTATPAPNDYMELGNHSEFCGVMTRAEMLSMFFVHDGGETSKWRLKGHAEDVFWQWLATFSVFVDNPNNIGYEIAGYNLPHINIQEIIVDGDTFKYHIENGMKVIDVHEQDFMNIDNDKILGAYAVAVMDDGRKVVEVMNINQLKKAWNQRMGGLKEDASSTHMKFKDQMAKKTVINRLCKLIGNTSTDGNISEISDRLDEVADVDMVADDVAYEIENNANTVDFEEVVEPQDEQATPEFMKE